jgi:hypothetical protein|tara:strand:+ start:837 stop:1541 length:705 start_codon:yes stop_codon:yes gene_type:complete
MISMLQNFVVTKQERLDTLKETLPDVAKFFDIDFHVNYNSDINFKEVLSLYEDNVNSLTFYNDLSDDWGKITQSMLSEIDTKYVFIMPEDFILSCDDKDYFNSLIEELDRYDCEHMIMHRIDYVKNYGTDKKYFHLYDEKDYLFLCNSDKYPTSCLSSVAIYRKDFLEQFLEFYNSQEKPTRFSLATPNCYEWFSYNKVAEYSRIGGVKNRLFAVPKESIVKHYEPNDIKERKV